MGASCSNEGDLQARAFGLCEPLFPVMDGLPSVIPRFTWCVDELGVGHRVPRAYEPRHIEIPISTVGQIQLSTFLWRAAAGFFPLLSVVSQ